MVTGWLRSWAFNVSFYAVTAAFLIFGIPLLLAPRKVATVGLRAHARTINWLLRHLVGVSVIVRGEANLPSMPALIVAKHQSTWDTIFLQLVFRDPAFVLKAELLKVPLYGTFVRKFDMIPIARDRGPQALRSMTASARKALQDGRDILVFPEGTRRKPGAKPAYKSGFAHLADALNCPVIPVAVASGHVWPNHTSNRCPGTIVVEILPALAPTDDKTALKLAVETTIEDAMKRLETAAQ